MPTYEYKCPRCGTEFEVFQRITSKPGAKCPKCGGKATRQLSTGVGLHFKGSGFYLTDYGRAGQKDKQARREKAEAAPADKPKPESKPADTKPTKPKKDD